MTDLIVDFLGNFFSDPDDIRQFIILTTTGISEGTRLALIALGLVLIFKATDVINFAHGEFMLLGAYMGFELLDRRGLPLGVGLIAFILIMVGIGVMVERLILRRMIGEPVISVIMVTIGLSFIMQAFVGAYWGVVPQRLATDLYPDNITSVISSEQSYRWEIEGARRPALLKYDDFYTIIIVAILMIIFIMFFRKSREGIAMRAAADDQQAAMSMGISISRVFAVAWSIAALTAGIAGLMVADLTEVGGSVSGTGLRAFPVIILGGLDSIPGAIIGGLIIGMVEQYGAGYLDPSYKEVIPYLLLLAVLMVRPYGLFGQKRIERV